MLEMLIELAARDGGAPGAVVYTAKYNYGYQKLKSDSKYLIIHS